MATDKITVRNTLNGLTAEVPRSLLDNPTFSDYYVEVPPESKPLILHTPSTAEEFKTRRSSHEKSKGRKNLKSEDTNTYTTEEG